MGGGFGPGIHNVLEPAALGKPVLFGPRNGNSYEAGQLKNRGIGFECSNAGELSQTLLSLLGDPARMKEIGKKAEELVQENAGATDRIVKRLKEALFPHD